VASRLIGNAITAATNGTRRSRRTILISKRECRPTLFHHDSNRNAIQKRYRSELLGFIHRVTYRIRNGYEVRNKFVVATFLST
jgi:hypothetical protein